MFPCPMSKVYSTCMHIVILVKRETQTLVKQETQVENSTNHKFDDHSTIRN